MLTEFEDWPGEAITVEFWMLSADRCRKGVPFSYATGAYEQGDNSFLILNYNDWCARAQSLSGAVVTTVISPVIATVTSNSPQAEAAEQSRQSRLGTGCHCLGSLAALSFYGLQSARGSVLLLRALASCAPCVLMAHMASALHVPLPKLHMGASRPSACLTLLALEGIHAEA